MSNLTTSVGAGDNDFSYYRRGGGSGVSHTTHYPNSGEVGVGSLIQRITQIRGRNIPFFGPKRSLLTTEASLVKDVLYMLQGFASSHFLWDTPNQQFYIKNGVHVSHLSMSSLYNLLAPFTAAATSLRRVEMFVKKVADKTACSWLKFRPQALPTLEAFANAVSMRLEFLRKVAQEKELEAVAGGAGTTVTLLSLLASMSWAFAGAEFLKNVVQNAVPEPERLIATTSNGADMASHILSCLYEQLDEICLLEDGEEEAYRTILLLFVGTLRPMTKSLESWLQEGTLSDPSGEVFELCTRRNIARVLIENVLFLCSILVEDAAFWQHGYQLRHRSASNSRILENSGQIILKSQPLGVSVDISESQSSSSPLLLESGSPKRIGSPEGGSRTMASNHGGSMDEVETLLCPTFLQSLAKAVVSAGKSLQLLQHTWREKARGGGGFPSDSSMTSPSRPPTPFSPSMHASRKIPSAEVYTGAFSSTLSYSNNLSIHLSEDQLPEPVDVAHQTSQVSLFEELCISLQKLLAHDDTRQYRVLSPEPQENTIGLLLAKPSIKSGNFMEIFDEIQEGKRRHKEEGYIWRRVKNTNVTQNVQENTGHEVDVIHQPDATGNEDSDTQELQIEPSWGVIAIESDSPKESSGIHSPTGLQEDPVRTKPLNEEETSFEELRSEFVANFTLEEPQEAPWRIELSLGTYSELSALNDSQLREMIFNCTDSGIESPMDVEVDADSHELCSDEEYEGVGIHKRSSVDRDDLRVATRFKPGGTDYSNGQGCGNLLTLHLREDVKAMERLLPYPTELPSFQEKKAISEVVASHHQNEVAARMLDWLQQNRFKATPSPTVLVQECLISSIERRVHAVSKQLLERLMGEWRLMEELTLLRAIFLVGSGDLLQQFASVLFNKLDRGEPWDDYYELNTMLQESVRSSGHGTTSPALETLVVTVESRQSTQGSPGSSAQAWNLPLQITGRSPTAGIDTLDTLRFHYKVAGPLELIIDSNAINKYNQVMAFLLKVKRAKHALDKACRWTWKNAGGDSAHHKQRLLLQQKLMHFVNTLHQYVMDRVLYSAWVELSEGMSSAGSLDEVITCHSAYLVSIQRQCLVAPDKLWTLIAGRVKTILGLALDYYSIQRTLCDGVAAPAITARCQSEIERVERQFDECMVFLLRVLSFRLNVGHFPHLADLVTRINYNYYYMTEDGQILTPIPDTQGQLTRRPSRRL